ncbi:MAG TPA: hypothetical protein VLK78_09910 [Candidatus Angelobacter sp.]|nr:hypothetical protein [Candidatus Angelobacter sp.]
MVFENQLRQAIEMRRAWLIERLRTLSEDERLDHYTLSELEREWHYFLKQGHDETQAN